MDKLSRYLFVSLAVAVILFGCGDKPTEPEEPVYKKAIINAHVTDTLGNPVEWVAVVTKFYYYNVDSLLMMQSMSTDQYGNCSYPIQVNPKEGMDTVINWAVLVGVDPYVFSDTIIFQLEKFNDTISLEFELAI